MADDLGTPVERRAPARRVVSLVPSLTEAIAVTNGDALIGATDWCTHPPGLDVPRVRGTKNPDVAAIVELRPDLIVANREENRELDVRRLRAAGYPVWVTDIRNVQSAFASLRRLFKDGLRWDVPSWVDEADAVWREPSSYAGTVAVPIWRDPWMVVGSDTFTGDVLAHLGLHNVFAAAAERYPHTTPEAISGLRPDLVLLPDEPYPFGSHDGPDALPDLRCVSVSGRALTWYGPSLVTARELLQSRIRPLR